MVRNDPLAFFLAARSDNPIVPLELGPFRTTAVYDPTVAQHVLMHPEHFDKSTRAQRMIRALLGDGLLTSEGELWKSRRRLAQGAFRRPKLSVYATAMSDVSLGLAERWAQVDHPVDLNRTMMELTLEIAARCLFEDDLDGEADALDEALCSVLDSFHRMVTQPLARPEVLPIGPAATYRRAIAALDAIVLRLIERRRARGTGGDDLLHLWLHSGLDDEAIRNEVVTMLLAAHETTANALTWTWVLLSKNPASLRRLRDELEPLDSPEAVVEASLKRNGMPWTDAVFHETLRL
jgi:cytochrome P450